MQNQFRKATSTQGARVRILTEAVCSPTLIAQIEALLNDRGLSKAQWIEYEPLRSGNAEEGAEKAFGKPYAVHYDFDKADRILSLDADFLSWGPERLRYAADFSKRRRGDTPEKVNLNRLYAVEPTPTITGLTGDHRLPLRSPDVERFARLLARQLGIQGVAEEPVLSQPVMKWIKAAAKDLEEHKAKSIIVAGDWQPPIVHVLAHLLNHHLGNIGRTVFLSEKPASWARTGHREWEQLILDLRSGQVDTLLILGGNPVYQSAAFGEALAQATEKARGEERTVVFRHGLYADETSRLCQWQLPQAHFLESWGDARAADGTCTIQQPLIAPLYAGRSAIEVVASFTDVAPAGSYELVRAYWGARRKAGAFDAFWNHALHDGVVPGEKAERRAAALRQDVVAFNDLNRPSGQQDRPHAGVANKFEVVFRPDPSLYDGRFANNSWLQELPKQVTKLTWGNAALISPKTAKELGVTQKHGDHGGPFGELITDMVEVASLKIPAMITPGQADDVVTLHFGFGRERGGKVCVGVGANAFTLSRGKTATSPLELATVKKTGERFTLACTQVIHTMGGTDPGDRGQVTERGIIRTATVEHYKEHPDFVKHFGQDHEPHNGEKRVPLSLFSQHPQEGHQWGMSIDLTACIGCNACVIACQAENNISVVGKDQVTRGRSMHWIRVDRYFTGDENAPEKAYFQPIPCMHCENAPCELVCPVEATSHSTDGLNDMTYNRCVGTRYCSNNCPYKVRRFNFLFYADYVTESLKGLRNPDVTVRSRGVMEKCTYCVQRIRGGEIDAKNRAARAGNPADWAIRDGEVITSCQAACPTEAIVFGDIKSWRMPEGKTSRVSQRRALPLHYGLLTELNTVPRTTYLAALTNPNPELEGAEHGHS
jgi:molybdopterin-containing oxidoreductase family iron-sulfur binding subunit